MTTRQIFGENLRRIILEKEESLNKFADKHKLNRRMLGFWTAGDHFVTAEKIDQLCDWLGVRPEDLFREPGNKSENKSENKQKGIDK